MFSTLAAAFFLVSSAIGATCEDGDLAMGPNCVHVEREQEEDFEWVHSTVYRTSGGKKTVLWGRDLGEVLYSTPQVLAVRVTVQGKGGGPSEEIVAYWWDGSKYR